MHFIPHKMLSVGPSVCMIGLEFVFINIVIYSDKVYKYLVIFKKYNLLLKN